jgi:hypothetical protein
MAVSLVRSLTRRQFLHVGGAGLFGLTLPTLLRAEAERRQANGPQPKARNVIFVWLQGGPPHQDTFDMKPDAPAGIKSEFKTIPTILPGYHVCELLPTLAKQVNRLFILRGVHHHIADHNPGCMYMLGSCNAPNPVVFHPTWSAVVKKEFPERPGVPTAVAIPSEPTEGPGPGFLGPAYRSFATHGDPSAAAFNVRSLDLPPGVDLERLRKLRQDSDHSFADLGSPSPLLDGLDKFYQDAHEMILSPRTREAFRIDREPDRLRDRYGRTKRGQRLLLARRLIEAGVRFVTISEPDGWDTHEKNFERLRGTAAKTGLLPDLDRCLSALLDDLSDRGLLQETLVMVFGEFGRTPKINPKAGRDHWSQAMSIVLAGGGVPGGCVYGKTDAQAAFVKEHGHSPADFACTVYRLLGIDPHHHYRTPGGQPVPIVQGGEPIRAVLSYE